MKRLLLIVLLAVVVGSVGATQLTFQKLSDLQYANKTAGEDAANITVMWNYAPNGGNGYITAGYFSGFSGVRLKSPMASTYAAATVSDLVTATPYVEFQDADQSVLGAVSCNFTPGAPVRIEAIVIGTTAYVYYNGTRPVGQVTLTKNPSFIAIGAARGSGWYSSVIDNYVYGTTEEREIIDMPDGEVYYLVKDTANPANVGLKFINNDTLVSSTALTFRFGRSGLGTIENKSIWLKHITTDTIYETKYTGLDTHGSRAMDLTAFFASGAPYGFYKIQMEDSSAPSDTIQYTGTGATIYFDGDDYSQGDTATITYTVEDDYWLSDYDYTIKVYDGGTWQTLQTSTLSLKNGSVTYDFSDDDDAGVYYAVLVATNRETHAESWFALDWADLDAFVTFYGYVTNQDGTVLSGANVSVTQGDLYDNALTIADGNYTATGFYAGASTRLNVTATGYSQWDVYVTPPAARRVYLNFTMNTTTPTVTGLGIGGVARDGVFDDTTREITMGYGRPLSSATVYLWNFSTNQTYTKQTNVAGWYLCDDGSGCSLVPGRIYDVQGRKAGYNNSQNYTVVTS